MMEYKVVVSECGDRYWYKPGMNVLHREDGPAIEYDNGSRRWYRNGQLHREDGPAIEYAIGTKHWFLNGRHHREDGPAVEYANGTKYWYLDGYSVSEEEHRRRTQPEKEMTVEQIAKELGYRIKIIEG